MFLDFFLNEFVGDVDNKSFTSMYERKLARAEFEGITEGIHLPQVTEQNPLKKTSVTMGGYFERSHELPITKPTI